MRRCRVPQAGGQFVGAPYAVLACGDFDSSFIFIYPGLSAVPPHISQTPGRPSTDFLDSSRATDPSPLADSASEDSSCLIYFVMLKCIT
jgi:hypothetical protein